MKKTMRVFLLFLLCTGMMMGIWLSPADALAAPANGWSLEGGIWYYYSNSVCATDWLLDAGKWYYFMPAMVVGWKQIGGVWYYFEGSGAMVTGWKHLAYNGSYNDYYFDANGAMQTGWVITYYDKKMHCDYLDGSGAWVLSQGEFMVGETEATRTYQTAINDANASYNSMSDADRNYYYNELTASNRQVTKLINDWRAACPTGTFFLQRFQNKGGRLGNFDVARFMN